ncbi:hypothetical protein AAMO2058_001104000 [Amorphochlora amoebiformis]
MRNGVYPSLKIIAALAVITCGGSTLAPRGLQGCSTRLPSRLSSRFLLRNRRFSVRAADESEELQAIQAYAAYSKGEIDIERYKEIALEVVEANKQKLKSYTDQFREKFGQSMAERMGVPLDRIIIESVEAENPEDDIEKLLADKGKGIKVNFAISQKNGDPNASVMLMAAQGGQGAENFNVAKMVQLTPEQEQSFAEVYQDLKSRGVVMANAMDFDGLSRVLASITPKLTPDQQAILVNMGLQIAAMQPKKAFFDPDDDPMIMSNPVRDLNQDLTGLG